jgi:isopentenyl phosphate kinase
MGKSANPQPSTCNLQFLKLGGSLITDKARPHTPRPDALARLAQEIAAARQEVEGLQLVLGHGSGSFGHAPAQRYGTRQSVSNPEQWRGFAEVWREAAALNRIVMDALHTAGLPAVAFPPSASVVADDGTVATWDLTPLQAALSAGLLPVIYGDVAFDRQRGGTILSTEDLFDHLARCLRPQRVLLAGLEPGVWADYPACTRMLREITPTSLSTIAPSLGGSHAVDVTGGMASKVRQSLALTQEIPGLEVLIFSGEIAGEVKNALSGEKLGTIVKNTGKE